MVDGRNDYSGIQQVAWLDLDKRKKSPQKRTSWRDKHLWGLPENQGD